MAEELKNSEEESNATDSDKNWKEMREKVELYENKIAEFEAKERTGIFTQAGLDTSKGVGKAVEMMYEGDLTVEGVPSYQRTGLTHANKSSFCLSATLSERIPPPTGVVKGPLIETRPVLIASNVASGSHSPVWLNAFSPARVSLHVIDFAPE